MPTREQCEWFLKEHGPYELRLVRHGLRGMVRHRRQSDDDELWDYNAYFECFAVKARAIADFLTNKFDPRNEKKKLPGGRNIIGQHFVPGWELKAPDEINSLLKKLKGDAIHIGKERSSNADEKVTLGDCWKLANWIEDEMPKFLAALAAISPGDRALWNERVAGQRVVAGGTPALLATTTTTIDTVIGWSAPGHSRACPRQSWTTAHQPIRKSPAHQPSANASVCAFPHHCFRAYHNQLNLE